MLLLSSLLMASLLAASVAFVKLKNSFVAAHRFSQD